jgi:hypothetical protein
MLLDRASTRLVSIGLSAEINERVLDAIRKADACGESEDGTSLAIESRARENVGLRCEGFAKRGYRSGTKIWDWTAIETSRCSVVTFRLRNSPFFFMAPGVVNVRKY